MKEENNSTETAVRPTQEDVVRIFMQYLGHSYIRRKPDCFTGIIRGYVDDYIVNELDNRVKIENNSVWVKPLASISDEECCKLYHAINPKS